MKRKEDFITNLTKFYILVLLNEAPRHGYDIIEELGKRTGKKPSAGQVYPLLKSFQRAGYVTQETVNVGRKKKKVYTLTHKGKDISQNLLEKFSDTLDFAIKQRVTKCAHCSCEIYKGAYREKMGGKSLAFCCQSCAKAF